MALWTGLGINYGHSVTSATYDTSVVEQDLTFLWNQGIRRLRIAGPGYASSLTIYQDMCLRAMAHGFYVIWGVSTGVASPNLTASIWTAYKPAVSGSIATWAQAHHLPEFQIGNECDFEADGTTLTATTVRADVRTLCATVKSGGYTGVVSYAIAATPTTIGLWNTDGLGTLDKLGANNYNGGVTGFNTVCTSLVADFGTKAYVSEFDSPGNGYSDFNDENTFASDAVARVSGMQAAGIGTGYFFCYRDGANGVTANSFALVLNNDSNRVARGALLSTAGQTVYSNIHG